MGGGVSLSSELGKGSKFEFTVLLGIGESKELNASNGHFKESSDKACRESIDVLNSCEETFPVEVTSNCRVLLVEDNRINQEVALMLLEDFGVAADAVSNGLEAIKALLDAPESAPYNLVLMDCQMPEMDGYEATRSIRNGGGGAGYSGIPIVAMTANAMKGDREKCIDAGMNDYLTKPIDTEALEIKLKEWLVDKAKEASVTDSVISVQSVEGESSSPHLAEPEIMVWDEKSALARVRGRRDRLLVLISSFLESTPELVDQLQQSIQGEDIEKAMFIAHTMKGVAVNLGGLQLHALTEKLEMAGESRDMGQLASVFEEFVERYEDFAGELMSYQQK